MARRVHAEGLRERQNMRNHDPSGKWDVGYVDDDGRWCHITRVSDETEARERAERLNESDEPEPLLGLDGSEDIEVRPAR